MTVRDRAPWWLRIALKLVIARLPIPYVTWQRIGVFRHGAMDDTDYALSVVRRHLAAAGVDHLRGRTVLELGPGDSIATALIAAALGGRAILVDTAAFAPEESSTYLALAERLRASGLHPPDLAGATSRSDVIAACGAEYITDGLAGLRRVPSSSVDLVFSQAVLEHIRRRELPETLREANRVLKSDGISSHTVDLRDHLGGGLANLRIPTAIWESRMFAGSGFYTNRVGFAEFTGLLEASHADVLIRNVRTWDSPPVARRRLSRDHRDRTEHDLRVQTFDVVMRRRDSAT